ncbi:DUF190 domain-containing protein [Flexistipes sinusarabici]|uniref:DUF190 domain-containing protein n=1 Tax=Flexistipes sinusarabici TaxID=2352 RepID=UPI002356E07F
MTKLEGTQKLMRIFIGENDKYEGRPLYKSLVELCREKGIAGATVIRGVYGYGASSVIHSSRTLALSNDLPLIVEVVDSEDKINHILPEIDKMIGHGLITIEIAHVIKYE